MDNNYFVTVNGKVVADNITNKTAINRANKEYEKIKSTLGVGIGRRKYVNGKPTYTLLPMHFFTL